MIVIFGGVVLYANKRNQLNILGHQICQPLLYHRIVIDGDFVALTEATYKNHRDIRQRNLAKNWVLVEKLYI